MVSSLDLGILAPKESFRRLSWLGRFDWLQIKPLAAPLIDVKTVFPAFDGRIALSDYNSLKRTVEFAKQANIKSELMWLWTLSRLFMAGPKLFRPTVEQCEAMCQVDIDIPVTEYRQPYPVIMYEYPLAFCQSMAAKLGCARFPKIAVCNHAASYGAYAITLGSTARL
jgi:hypothetical protein